MIKIKEKVYGYELLYFNNIKDCDDYMKKNDMIRDGGEDAFSFVWEDATTAVIMVHNNHSPEMFYAEIAHEIMHVVFEIMRRVPIELQEGSEEAYTYLHTYYMFELLKKIKK